MSEISKDKLIFELESANAELKLILSKCQNDQNKMNNRTIEFMDKVLDEKATITNELIDIRGNALFVQYGLGSLIERHEENIVEFFEKSQNVCSELENIILRLTRSE